MKSGRFGSFLLNLGLNLLLNIEMILPAVILLVLHYVLGLPIWLFWCALGIWVFIIAVRMLILSFVNRCSNDVSDVKKENKNPYSAKKYTPINTDKNSDTFE